MAITRFNDPILVPGGQLEVGGPFDPESDVIIGDVTICFLLMQDGPRPNDPPVIVHSRAAWNASMGDTWQTVIPAGDLRVGAVRTIGAAIIVRTVAPEPVPLIEAVTWCVSRTVQEATVAA
jgi:hypothetical protein